MREPQLSEGLSSILTNDKAVPKKVCRRHLPCTAVLVETHQWLILIITSINTGASLLCSLLMLNEIEIGNVLLDKTNSFYLCKAC